MELRTDAYAMQLRGNIHYGKVKVIWNARILYLCKTFYPYMSKQYIEEKTFEKIDFSEQELVKGEYENCTFINCNFPNTALSGINFADCTFTGCNLSLSKLAQTALRDIKFKDCKLLGVHFESCSEFLFSVDFDGCMLNLSSFYKRNLKKARFKNCSLHEVDFSEADMSGSLLENCDLAGATFDHTILEKADLRSAYNFSIDPESNRIRKAKFSVSGIQGLLSKYNIEIHP